LLLLALTVGFVEESGFRGLMLTALRERGVWRAIIVTSVLFGLTHLANVLAGATVLETISQVAYTIAFGVAFAALVLRTGIIWPLVLAHAAIDAAYFLQLPGFAFSTTWTLIINLGAVVVFTAYGIVVMRRDPGLVAAESGTRAAGPGAARTPLAGLKRRSRHDRVKFALARRDWRAYGAWCSLHSATTAHLTCRYALRIMVNISSVS
jgi:hypothetical protein